MKARPTRWIISAILLFLVAGVASAVLQQALVLGTLSSTTAQVGVPYSATIQASGGVSPYNFTITSGALPHNLTFSPTGNTSGPMTISGTPDTVGTANFTVMVTDFSLVSDPLTPSTGPANQASARRRGLAQDGNRAATNQVSQSYSITVAPAAPSSTPVPPSVWMAMTGLAGAGLFRLRQKRRG